jgi:hypothetical protein
VQLLAAYAHQTRGVLAQAETVGNETVGNETVGNETVGNGHEWAGVQAVLAALPGRLLSGRVVTDDALLATRALCQQIVQNGARGRRRVRRLAGAPAPLTREAVALRFADPWTPRQQVVVVGDRQGDREERRTRAGATELAPYLAQAASGAGCIWRRLSVQTLRRARRARVPVGQGWPRSVASTAQSSTSAVPTSAPAGRSGRLP